MTDFVQFVNVFLHCIPRLCNGSTSDSGSDCGGSSPPWGNKTRITWILWSLRLSVRTKDSQSLKRGSIPLGTVKAWFSKPFFIPKFQDNFPSSTRILPKIYVILISIPRIIINKYTLLYYIFYDNKIAKIAPKFAKIDISIILLVDKRKKMNYNVFANKLDF